MGRKRIGPFVAVSRPLGMPGYRWLKCVRMVRYACRATHQGNLFERAFERAHVHMQHCQQARAPPHPPYVRRLMCAREEINPTVVRFRIIETCFPGSGLFKTGAGSGLFKTGAGSGLFKTGAGRLPAAKLHLHPMCHAQRLAARAVPLGFSHGLQARLKRGLMYQQRCAAAGRLQGRTRTCVTAVHQLPTRHAHQDEPPGIAAVHHGHAAPRRELQRAAEQLCVCAGACPMAACGRAVERAASAICLRQCASRRA
eukprot:365847-Chlamydomonas_euryale.AAC.26